jgi:hypothetical protein
MTSILGRIATQGMVVLMALLLAACGGDEAPGAQQQQTSAPPASAAPEAGSPAAPAGAAVVAGTVTGFSSTVAVDGVDYSAAAGAGVVLDVDPRAATAATMADVKLGQQVEVELDAAGQATKVFVRATVIGPVEAVDVNGGSFKVLGQTIKVVTSGDARTVFDGIGGLVELKIGDWTEVHGTLDAERNIVATRVEVRPAAGVIKVKVAGLVKTLNAAAKTFKLGELTVNFSAATVMPEGATIDNDVFVVVYSEQLPAAGTLAAKAIRVVKMPTLEGRRFHVGGLVTDAAADGKKFKVNGLAIDATDAELKGGPAPSFANVKDLALVRVEGTLTATPTVVLKATRVWLIPASEQRRVILAGQVTDFTAPAASFKLRGVPVNAKDAKFVDGKADDLKTGAFVLIKGRIDGAVVRAEEVRFDAPPRGMEFRLFGVVSEFKAADGSFKLLGVAMKLAPTATFEGGTKADFSDGDVVEVKGSFDGTVFVVSKVGFKPASTTPSVYLEGTISNVAATGFTLNGTAVKLEAGTEIRNGPLANGQRVEVRAQLVGADVVAREVEVEVARATARLMGTVSDLKVADKTFVVRGQTVSWSATTQFRWGAEADLSNGDLVRVDATLAAGKVNATMITFLKP